MHFHLPKPLHGWRAFLGEVGIIVLGVLIALAAEQATLAAHERSEAGEANAIIRGELEFNLGRLRSRAEIAPCVTRRIEEVQSILDHAADTPAIATPSWVGRPQFWTFHSSRWQAEAQGGRAALIDPGQLAEYGTMYGQMQDLRDEMTAEQTDWAKLRTLERVRRLEPVAAFELNLALQDARYRAWRLALVSSQLFDRAATLRLRATRNATAESRSVCLPMTTPRAEANRVSVWPVGEP